MTRSDTTEAALEIRPLEERDIQPIVSAFDELGWSNRCPALYQRYLSEQDEGRRTVLVALADAEFVGYLTIDWKPVYPLFRQGGIPEITDFNVLPQFRRRGIGTRLMDEAERRIAERSPVAGIGFGLTPDYGPAQRMYVKRGYVPDGMGIRSNDRYVNPGDRVTVDDGLALFLTKRLA